MKNESIIKTVIFSVLGVFVFSTIFGFFYIVGAGERAVLLTFGNPDMIPKTEGLHFKMPFVQKAVIMDIKTQKYEADLTSASKDLQDVNTKVAINYHLDSDSVPRIYKEIGIDYSARVIQPLEQEANKAITSQFTAEELITKRDVVRQKMQEQIALKLVSRGIIVEEVSIINFAFSPSFTQAIEQKVTAEQNALTAKNKLEQVKYEAQQRVAQATAEAEAIKIQASAIQAQGGKDYVQLQAIAKWNGIMPTYVGGGVIPFINIPMNGNNS